MQQHETWAKPTKKQLFYYSSSTYLTSLNPAFSQKYSIQNEIGKGATAFVVSAIDKETGEKVVVKFIFKVGNRMR